MTNRNGDLSIRQFVEAWRILCTAAPGHTVDSSPGVEYIFSGVPIAFFNAAILTGKDPSAEALQEYGYRTCEWAAPHGMPWLLIVTHENEPGDGWAAPLDACGLAPLMSLTGMVTQQVTPPARVPNGLELRVPENDAACETLLDVNAAAYGMPFDAAKHVWGRQAFWKDHTPVLGLAETQPVSCAAVLMVDGYRYVALVATEPGQQKKGYAEAAMRQALEVARHRHGDRPTFLHATEAGRPIYEKMGYEKVATHAIFMEKKFLGGH